LPVVAQTGQFRLGLRGRRVMAMDSSVADRGVGTVVDDHPTDDEKE
jgi:hypothetical protein